jgi:hypothetical protein
MKTVYRNILTGTLTLALLSLSACTSTSNLLNPFYEDPSPVALKGEMNDHALNGTYEKEDVARKALESMATYERAHTPEPAKPVMRPAVVRLMWVPDHLNRAGDLVPAHYYYLKVKKEDFAVKDAFELEQQLQGPGGASNVPYVYESSLGRKN